MTNLKRIDQTKTELRRVKPRSRRRFELETRLRDLMVKQLKQEIHQKVGAA